MIVFVPRTSDDPFGHRKLSDPEPDFPTCAWRRCTAPAIWFAKVVTAIEGGSPAILTTVTYAAGYVMAFCEIHRKEFWEAQHA